MIKFIHTGDLHLGLQFKSVSFHKDIANERRLELWSTFNRIVYRAMEEKVDFLFIAGDLFEGEYFTLADIKRVRDTLARAKELEIIIVAGNHDNLHRESLYHMIDWPANVKIFPTQGIGKKEFPDKNTCIYGYSWDRGENRRDIFRNFKGPDPDKINILILHGDLFDSASPYLPLDKNYLTQLNFDYIGLGHIHKPNIISNKMAYCGSPEPLNFGELGEHGIIRGIIEDGRTQIELLPFSKRQFIVKEITIKEDFTYLDILDRIKSIDCMENLNKNFYRVIMAGIVGKDVEINVGDMEKSLKDLFYHLEILDNTQVDYDLDRIERDNRNNVIGYFLRKMKEKNLEDPLIKDALYIGLEALMKDRV